MTTTEENGRVAVITGGAGGMGLATARVVGRDHVVVLTDVHEDQLARARDELARLSIDCHAVTCDVTDAKSVGDLATTASAFGPIASVIHTAGVSPQVGSVETIVKVNALGTVLVNQAFLPHAHPGLSVVNVASTAGHLPAAFPVPKRAYDLAFTDPDGLVERIAARCNLLPAKMRPGLAYAISKHFVIWWSRKLTGPLGRVNGRIVSVSPGSFDTEMGRLEENHGAGELAALSALARFGTVEEIAEVLAFLASDKPGYLTGTDILVDGGAQATMTLRDTIAMARQA